MIARCLGENDVEVDVRRPRGVLDGEVSNRMTGRGECRARPLERLPYAGIDPVAEVRPRDAEDEPLGGRWHGGRAGGGRPVRTSKSSATSATLRAIGPR